MKVFVDTSGFIALVMGGDQFHIAAEAWWAANENGLVTSNLVLIELMGWLRYMAGAKFARKVARTILENTQMKIERITALDEKAAFGLFDKISGRGLSMVDCTSYVVTRRLGIKTVFGFDTDFSRNGFELVPK
ncbi:MAG: PIN domain-containing protein [Patescibacteria group bacterium]